MKCLFHLDLHVNYIWLKLATQITIRKNKSFPRHNCHYSHQNPPVIQDIHTIYAELLTPGGRLYVPSLSVVINLSFSASIGLPFIWCRRRCFGERFARELNTKKTKRQREKKKNKKKPQDKGNHISFCSFFSPHSSLSFSAHSILVILVSALPSPSFSSQSH